ncbi:ABC transporter ATP-binding protein [Geminisphaera colitermitum]|uniref:ABC transporter ATP-binding protein n=1 Tax=Geminisphaera colitermitum TaxID=1148786 RepID=UPI000158DF14|nr:ABC transporter ATP-binding protein [Geminisphaera colitermitum]
MASDLSRFRPYLRYLKPVAWQFVVGILCGSINGIAGGFALPYMIKHVLPQIFGEGAAEATFWQLAMIAVWLPTVLTIRGLSEYFNAYLIQFCGTRILEQVRLEFFAKLQRLPLSFFQGQRSGDLISRGMSDTNQLQVTLSNVASDSIKEPVTLISTIGFVTYLGFQQQGVIMVLVCLAVVPLTVLPIRYAGRKIVRRASQLQKELGSVTNVLSENLSAAREVRAFGLEERETKNFAQKARQLITFQMKVVKYDKAIGPAVEIISGFGISLTLIYAYKVHVPWETFVALIAALYASYSPIKKLGGMSNAIKRGLASLDRIEEVLHEPDTITDPVPPATPAKVGRLRGDIAFEGVNFAYKTGGELVLNNINARLPAGTVCALVGPSGAGKSTFANLVPRFFDTNSGRVTIDGIDIRDMRLADLRRNIALVSQEALLFNDTIYNNLLLSRPDATRAEVEQAARNAYAHDFILTLPQGYETIVGERGASLSGGQRQRIALARAFLRNAPILILDEATSALDSESEAAIQKSLTQLVQGKTVLMIAHRFSTIRDATMILLFDQGRIIDRGPHAQLYTTSPLYRALYDRQSTA